MFLLWSLLIGGSIGWFAGIIVGRDIPGGVIGNVAAGFVGAWIGNLFLGSWGPVLGTLYIFPTLLGAIILVLIVSLIMSSLLRSRS
ncbi:GlsB/YeaQ/YmgE family stress response membrane protein [Paenibacillus turicensis]|uniref:GlsB/YeaQ/YmgE family stress response membrane protein n=1 Tax=Paenibacillus turicensis TaxID=160487 RepID=UPI003D2A5FD3